MTERSRGKLARFFHDKGYGFIEDPENPSGKKRIFLHISEVLGGRIPTVGDVIEFEVEMTPKGRAAVRARIATDTDTAPASASAGTAAQAPATPYTFLPVTLTTAAEGPEPRRCAGVSLPLPGHDGRNASGRYSGEMKLTITAHTPLLVGAVRYKVNLPDQSRFAPTANDTHNSDGESPRVRYLLEPWRLGDGRVVLAGSSIKGMIRHHVGALLNAPMERVYEQYFSYRPNLDVRGPANAQAYKFREAVIETAPDSDGSGLRVRVLAPGRQAIYVRKNVLGKLGVGPGGRVLKGTMIREVEFDSRPQARRLSGASAAESWTADKDYILATYCGGMTGEPDSRGESVMTRLHAAAGGQATKLYTAVLVPTGGRTTDVGQDVVLEYQQTYRELADTEHGHCSSRNPIVGNDKGRQEEAANALTVSARLEHLTQGTLIYVEIDQQGEIVSLGHHFRYRWGYRDTVRRLDRSKTNRVRPELEVTEDERKWAANPEERTAALSPVRAMFGYAADEKIHGNCFSADYSRLAGRIAVNHGVEVVDAPTPQGAQRFLEVDGCHVVPLQELGAPKASAVEFYIKQSDSDNEQGRLTTYGDLRSAPDSELAGRKFYRHQPQAAADPNCYLAATDDDRRNNRATLARYVSAPGSRFRCTLRFRDLSEQELGALMFVLGIHNADNDLVGKEVATEYAGEHPAYALKLGYARPLGWGSVTMQLDAVRLLGTPGAADNRELVGKDLTEWRTQRVRAFIKARDGLAPNLDDCLNAWRFAGRGTAEYPTETNDRGETAIFHYHSGLRRAHSRNRRSPAAPEDAQQLRDKLAIVRPAHTPDSGDDRQG